MARLPQHPKVKTRTEREDLDGPAYVLIAGAPRHYIAGFGIVGAGDVVTLPPGVSPGQWLEPIAESDAVKVASNPDLAAELAEAAAERKREAGTAPHATGLVVEPGNPEAVITPGAGVPVSDNVAAAGGTPEKADAEKAKGK